MLDTTYTNFSAIDFRGNNSLSTFSLSNTPLLFIPNLESDKYRVVWDFGDGTISKNFSEYKYFSYPGVYNVKMVIYDCDNNANISTFSKDILVKDFITNTFDVNYVTSLTSLNIKTGEIFGPFVINSYFPHYLESSNIYYNISGSNSNNYWDVNTRKYSHLLPFNTLYEKLYNYSKKTYYFNEIEYVKVDPDDIFAVIENNDIVICDKSQPDCFYVGMSSKNEIYIKDDLISDKIKVFMFFDKTKNIEKYYNNLGVTLSARIVENVPNDISITSNGLDGEKYNTNSFSIYPIKFYDTKIPFVVKLKDKDWFSIKDSSSISISSLNIEVVSIPTFNILEEGGQFLLTEYGEYVMGVGDEVLVDTSCYSISSMEYDFGGAFMGYIEFKNLSNDILQNVKLKVSATIQHGLSTYELYNESNYFNVYYKDYFDLYKVNENFNAKETLKNLRFQEFLLDKNVIFDEFFGDIMGQHLSHEELGVKTYEKISNFVQNTQDIDNCEIDFIKSLANSMDYNFSIDEKYIYPEKIKRLMNLLSIDKTRLLGFQNKFSENFNNFGMINSQEYGINLGDKIDVNTYTLSSNKNIVAFEKFSSNFQLLNTFQPVSSVGSHTYKLSSYSSDWGWPLVLPPVFNIEDIEKYYIFFEYNDIPNNTIIGGVVDFNNEKTKITDYDLYYSNFFGENGAVEHMFSDTLYQSLSLIK